MKLKTFDEMEYHPTSERLVQILCDKTQNTEPLFFRTIVAHFLCVVASSMRCKVKTLDRGEIPVNMYAIGLSTSGSGKGFSINMMEEQVVNQFNYNFREETFTLMAETNLPKLAHQRAIRKNVDPDEELARTEKEFVDAGPVEMSFNSATESAIKQLRHKLLMADSGALNLQIDEIGSNLTGETEALNAFLELFDVGKIKNSLRKNGTDNKRVEAIDGRTPTNMLLFGTPSRLFNGGKEEEGFYTMCDSGMARRCFFAYLKGHNRNTDLDASQILALRTDTQTDSFINDLSDSLGALADVVHAHKKIQVSEPVTLLFIQYQLECERAADKLPDHDEMQKAELSHRYFKALKLAGAYAFVDGSPEITEDHAYYALKLAEESGAAFKKVLKRDRNYVKLANYIADVERNVTQADLVEDLPFYPKAANQQRDMMTLAIAHGYQNNILIKRSFSDGIEFLRGETLKATDLNQIRVSYSTQMAHEYQNEFAPFDQLDKLTQSDGLHWINHHVINGHRSEDDCIPGFNMVVIDVDGAVNLSTAKMLLKDYMAWFYTTKRSTAQTERFRILIPTNFELSLDAKDYKDFMNNLFTWLPFEVDEATDQRSKKWLSHAAHSEFQDGQMLDVLPFIPKTTKNEEREKKLDKDNQQSLDNLERWVINNTGDGNRNNQLIKYAYILVDAGFDFEGVRSRVMALNEKIPDKLDEAEIMSTVMVTAGKALAKQ